MDPAPASASGTQHTGLLRAESLSYRYRREGPDLFSGLSAEVAPGEPLAVRGPNGSGKSTLLKILAGFIAPTRGVVSYNGRGLALRRSRYRSQVVYSGGAPLGFYPRLTGEENLRLLAGVEGRNLSRRGAGEILERVGLERAARSRYLVYSLGMRQRLHLAGIMASTAAIWLLDEPTNGVDQEGKQLCIDVLTSAPTKIVVFVSHDEDFVATVARHSVELG